jgi:parallel beta-helix repeat protein
MKTLAQVEPRTPISALPATITTSGSYYVTTNLTCTACTNGIAGITIVTSDVTLDLNGFTVLGVAGSGNGITVPNPERNLAIRNGVLDSWGGNGVNAANGYNSQFERLRESNSGGDGLDTGSNCVVLVCSVSANAGDGIDAGNNSTVKDCTASVNSSVGIAVNGDNCTIKDCTVSGNSADGIAVNGNNCTVKDCTASGNDGEGINVADNCTVKDCTASGNYEGIYVFGNNCQIAGNTCSGNSLYGVEIYGVQNRIDGNSVGNNISYGINPDTANVTNSITRNSSPGPGYGNFLLNNDYAPIGKPNTSTNPWQNF